MKYVLFCHFIFIIHHFYENTTYIRPQLISIF